MPFQNRVDPFGTIAATSARGTVMGNRGCLHDDQQHPLRQFQAKRWIICKLAFQGRRRKIMAPWQYTELFFLDEATALAAGHRPCYECNRQKFNDYRTHWSAANPELAGGTPNADTIDAILHRERISAQRYQRDKIKLTYTDRLDHLPDGTFVALDGSDTPYLVLGNAIFPWSFEGYGLPRARPATTARVLTPRSAVRALAHGYAPEIHSSARQHKGTTS